MKAEPWLARIERSLLRPVDVSWLAAYRILLGSALAVSMERFLAYGWVDELLVDPSFRFHYWGMEWVTPLSRGGMHALFWALLALGLAVAAGAAFRVTAPLFAAGLTYIQLIDVSTYLNHYYLAALLAWLLALSPAHRAWSVDAWLGARWRTRGERQPPSQAGSPLEGTRVAAAWLYLFRVQIGVVYVFASLAKAQSDWLLHGQPLGIWLGASTSIPVLGRLFTIPGVPLAMSWFGFLFDATIVLWLSLRRTRRYAYAVVVIFHVFTRLLFDIGMFPIIMTASALIFFPPTWPRDLAARVKQLGARLARSPLPQARSAEIEGEREVVAPSARNVEEHTSGAPRGGLHRAFTRGALVVGALYCLVQVLVPLRCHLVGGNVLWHEQGMRLSWRVMVRAKGGATTFHVREKLTGRVLFVSPRDYLTPMQENEMASQPDLVLQLAHHIARDYEARGRGPVEVRVDSLVSLNGRRGQRMIDPDVDLTTVRDGLGRADWILPGPSDPPPPTHPVL